MVHAYAGKIRRVNLSKEGGTQVEPFDAKFAKVFLGGKGFGAKFLYDLVGPGTDPLGPSNVIVYCTGPLTGTLAPTNRYCIVTKSPLTGLFSDSYAGGYFSQELKYAGYDVLIISGKAGKPVYIRIDDGNVEVKPADHLWGLDTYQTYEVLKNDLKDRTVKISCIGPAGERMVKYALVDSDYHRQAGRCGTGAVMGSKNLKAIAVRGTGEISVADPKAFDEAVWKSYQEIRESTAAQEYTRGGTQSFTDFSNHQAFFPARNFQDGCFEGYENLGEQSQKRHLWLRESGCFSCPIHCTKVGMIRRGKWTGTVCDIIEYESVGLLGGNCGISFLEGVAYANLLCDKLGLDTISTGNVIGFAMECYERGILNKSDTDGLDLTFGNWEAQKELIEKIAYREGLGDILAEGVLRAAKQLGRGAEDIAVHVKGMEAPAWGPRGSTGMGLALATSDRGCDHQRAWPIAYETGQSWAFGGPLDRLALEGKAEVVKWEQDHLSSLYSLVVCEFSRSGISNDTYAKMVSAATGWDIDYLRLLKYGERTWNLIRMFNIREGIGRRDDASLPKRWKEPLPSGPARGHRFTDEEFVRMLDDYYEERGWDREGRPKKEKLQELGLEFCLES